jgi:hypothetical protein
MKKKNYEVNKPVYQTEIEGLFNYWNIFIGKDKH